jgi:hypothetical protein
MCPHCLSAAVRDMRHDEADHRDERLWLLCGQCETWRSLVLRPRKARALERSLRRDRKRMARTLWLLEQAGMDVEMSDLIHGDAVWPFEASRDGRR